MARDLLRTEKKDYTDSLPRAMSIISSFDNHPKPAERTPDYSAIYQYLALVLEGKELPLLGPLESAVMLDLLYGVADKIAMSDTTRQRQVMRWKYKLLSSKVDTQNNQLFIRQARKALSNDFEEFENASNATVASGSSTQTSQTPSSSQQRSTVQTGTPSSSQQRSTGQTGTPSSKQQRSTVPADTNTATMSGSAPGQSTTSTAISRSTRVANETTVISHNSDKSANPVPTAKKQLGPPKKRHKNSEVEFSIRRETDIIVSKNLLISDNETAEGVGNNSLKVKEKGRIQEGVRAGRHKAGADSDSIQVLGDEDESPPVKRRRDDADEIESHPMPDSYVVRKDNEKTNSRGEILDSEQLNKQTDSEQMLSQNVGQRATVSTDESRPLESTQNQTQSPPSVKKKKAVGRPRKSVYKKKEDPVRADSVVPNQVFWRGPGRPAGAKKIIPERPEKVLEDPSEIPKKPSLYTLNPLCVPVSLLSLRNKPGCTSAQPVVRKKSFPAIISKKHSPLFNSQKNEGITSVSIHRMAAVIPVSKQHILLPNSATQKSQS
ncbi:uncharacterized protein LOC110450352 [Mizuhopecten yessoensis]|uniref:Uncharacterized protein n=1 Tax=Mizuhopecten yessoensis TaxID=6573 RepID=A0A210QP06_MIZYE|nr:uncharacterized protein LOC110450352 [Mizuhopecten yessoensis]OWF50470.1 hypothetical protein KP79_PYT22419 [Mizuhopecten yessoensis]